jgi:ion channel-forming bestrophin family protein
MTEWSFFEALHLFTIGKRLSLLLVGVAIYSVATELSIRWLGVRVPDWGGAVGLINTIILGLLMSLRDRAAYDRWWEARSLWGQLTNDSRNLAAKIAAFVPVSVTSPARVAETLAGFAVALNRHLRDERPRLQDLDGFGHEKDNPEHVPLYLARRLFGVVADWKRSGHVDGATLWILDPHLRGLLDVCGGCEKIRSTPLSRSYKSLLRTGLVVNMLAGPWLTMRELGLWGVPIFQLICFFLLGVEMIDTAMEEPFGRERDDLDLDRYCQTIRDGVMASLPFTAKTV